MKDAVSIFLILLGLSAIFVGSFYFVEPRSSAGVHAWWGILPRSGADAVQYLVIGLLAVRTGWVSGLFEEAKGYRSPLSMGYEDSKSSGSPKS